MILIIVVAYLTFLPNYTESTFPRFPVSPDIFRNFFWNFLGKYFTKSKWDSDRYTRAFLFPKEGIFAACLGKKCCL